MDNNLFTPGPLNTSATVKAAMLRDVGSRDAEFAEIVTGIRDQIGRIGRAGRNDGYEVIPMQGCGTFGIESVIGSVVPRGGKLLVLVNGAYGNRMAEIADRLNIETVVFRRAEDAIHDAATLREMLRDDADITDVAMVHCETSSGILNPVEELGPIVHECGRVLIVDAMSSFGGVPLNVPEARVDFLVSSSNKCVEGVPGFSFVIARRERLLSSRGRGRSVSLDLFAQWETLERDGQFRFTPPTHVMLAFRQALKELESSGGVAARFREYRRRQRELVHGMAKLGFQPVVPPDRQSPIITAFGMPDDPRFNLVEFHQRLAAQGHVIYPGKLTDTESFRIGTIGRLPESAVRDLLTAIAEAMVAMNVTP